MNHSETTRRSTVEVDLRRMLEKNDRLGAGNFLDFAVLASPYPDAELIWLERPCTPFFGGTFHTFSLTSLKTTADAYARAYSKSGIGPKDPVCVYLNNGVEYLVHYLALTSLGAIPVLTNGNLSPEIAVEYFRRVGAVGLFLDEDHRRAIAPHLPPSHGYRFVATDMEFAAMKLPDLPEWWPFAHTANDPVMITHSSGTTGVPKAVLLQHQPFFHGVRYRLGAASAPGLQRVLSALPHSHNSAIAYLTVALLSGNTVYIASDQTGRNVAARIREFKPTMVVAFPQTYVELTETAVESDDLRSVHFWFSGGDAAHEQHIRRLIELGAKGACAFVDGMGSSEMGFSLFQNVHREGSQAYDRCVGMPLDWVEAAVLDDTGRIVAPMEIGRLGVRAPSVTSGYWNDSVLTHRSILAGYWLTGDLAYRDENNRFYHVDRVPDLVRTRTGHLYSLATEELLLKNFPSFADCSIIAVPHSDGFEAAFLLVRLREDISSGIPDLLAAVNRVLQVKGSPPLAAVRVVNADEIPLGTTGKVLKRLLRERHKGIFEAT